MTPFAIAETADPNEVGPCDLSALFFGHPARVTDKIIALHDQLGIQRFELHTAHVDHAATMGSIELFGTQVAPLVADRLTVKSFTSRDR